MSKIRHITLPAGFVAAGVKAGIKASGKEDVAIIVGRGEVSAALMTTTNQVVGAPVEWCRKVLPKGFGRIRGIVINSGCSNVCTGERGRRDAEAMAARTARRVGGKAREILVASTGIIGRHLPMAKINAGIDAAAAVLGVDHDASALRAIMTTDTREKSAVVRFAAGRRTVTVAGIVKGAGMIAPSLATMICVVATDAEIAPALLSRVFRSAAGTTLNAVTIDSDESTSDTAVVMASGASGARIAAGSPICRKFAAALEEVLRRLAMAMARDGEGATRLVEIHVAGAASAADAKVAAMSVANSPLFKCAVHGGDPNWGRVLAALGKSPAKVDPRRTTVRIGGVKVFARGQPAKCDLRAVEKHLKEETVVVRADLGIGRGRFTAYTCDLSREYVAINADYHT